MSPFHVCKTGVEDTHKINIRTEQRRRASKRSYIPPEPLKIKAGGVIGQDYYPLQDVILPACKKIKNMVKSMFNQIMCKMIGKK